jgi:hypothetical protein
VLANIRFTLLEKVLEQVFDTYWPQFENKFKEIIEESETEEHVPERTDESILTEVLRTVRGMDRRIRSLESPQRTLFESDRVFSKKSQIDLDRRVYHMLKDGIPPEVVEEINTNEYPPHLVGRAIRRARSVIESESDAPDNES